MGTAAVKMRTVTGIGVGERATIGRLVRAETGSLANGSEIAVFGGEISEEALVELSEADFSAIVCAGEMSKTAENAARGVDIPVLFVSAEDIGESVLGENAVLYPDRGVLYVSPTVEVLDAFVAEEKSELADKAVYDVASGEIVGHSVEEIDGVGEEELFDKDCRLAEKTNGELVVCVKRGEGSTEQLRAIMRAGVYGRIAVAYSPKTMKDFCNFKELLSVANAELLAEGREFEGGVSVGAIADGMLGVLYARELCEKSDFFMADISRISEMCDGEDRVEIREKLVDMLRERIDAKKYDIRIKDIASLYSKNNIKIK